LLESISGESDDQHSKGEEEEEHQSITTIEDDKIQIVNSTTGKSKKRRYLSLVLFVYFR